MKKLIILLLCIFMITGCNKEPEISPEEKYYNHILEEVEKDTLSYTHYYYQQLTDQQKAIYVQIYEVVTGKAEFTTFFQEVHLRDYTIAGHYFYLDMPLYFHTHYLTSNFVGYTAKEIVVNEEPEEGVLDELDKKADDIIATMPEGLSDYDKVKWIFDWVIDNTEYDLNAENNQDIRSVFMTGKSVCAGYARAFQFLCQKAGIEAGYISGAATNNIQESDFHAWSFVKVDDKYYWVDPTWGDKYYYTDYSYMCITDEELFKSRNMLLIIRGPEFFIGEDIIAVPKCTDDSLNYFKKNNCYFDRYNYNTFLNFVLEHKDEKYFLCQFESSQLPDALKHLFENEEVFDILFEAYPNRAEIGVYYDYDEVTGTLYIEPY